MLVTLGQANRSEHVFSLQNGNCVHMKTREGIPEKQAYGPAHPEETHWVISPRPTALITNGVKGFVPGYVQIEGEKTTYVRCVSTGPTAFEACKRLGITLGDVIDIRPRFGAS
jgi:hypothetical protein